MGSGRPSHSTMALANFLLYTCSVLLLSFTSAALLDTRQAGSANVEEYLVQVRSVLLAIDAIRSTGASESCADVGFAGTVDAQGLDDQLAQTIVCAGPKVLYRSQLKAKQMRSGRGHRHLSRPRTGRAGVLGGVGGLDESVRSI